MCFLYLKQERIINFNSKLHKGWLKIQTIFLRALSKHLWSSDSLEPWPVEASLTYPCFSSISLRVTRKKRLILVLLLPSWQNCRLVGSLPPISSSLDWITWGISAVPHNISQKYISIQKECVEWQSHFISAGKQHVVMSSHHLPPIIPQSLINMGAPGYDSPAAPRQPE